MSQEKEVQRCEKWNDHDFDEISSKNLGPTDAIMEANGDCLYEVTSQCKICGEIKVWNDV